MFQEPVLLLVLRSADVGLRLCGPSGKHAAQSTLVAVGGEGDWRAQLRVEPGFRVQDRSHFLTGNQWCTFAGVGFCP